MYFRLFFCYSPMDICSFITFRLWLLRKKLRFGRLAFPKLTTVSLMFGRNLISIMPFPIWLRILSSCCCTIHLWIWYWLWFHCSSRLLDQSWWWFLRLFSVLPSTFWKNGPMIATTLLSLRIMLPICLDLGFSSALSVIGAWRDFIVSLLSLSLVFGWWSIVNYIVLLLLITFNHFPKFGRLLNLNQREQNCPMLLTFIDLNSGKISNIEGN